MFRFRIRHIGVYRMEQYLKEDCHIDGLGLTISGVRRRIAFGRDLTGTEPSFQLSIKGEPFEVDFGPDRENWVVILEDYAVRLSPEPGFALVGKRGEEVQVPLIVPVEEERVPGWRAEFQRMQEALQSPTPANLLRAELGVANIFRFMLDSESDTLGRSPAQRLRALIDEDVRCEKTLNELSESCGFTSDHLRVLFEETYGMAPNAYRNQRRMALATDLLANSELSVKEISYRLGFKHVPAFSSMFRRLSGGPPSDVICKFRYG